MQLCILQCLSRALYVCQTWETLSPGELDGPAAGRKAWSSDGKFPQVRIVNGGIPLRSRTELRYGLCLDSWASFGL